MELVGTFALCYVGGMTGTSAGNGLLQVGLAHGLVLGIMVYAGAHVSGGHFNPAVSLALLTIRKCPVLDACLYMVFQFVGGILAGLLVNIYLEENGKRNCGCPSVNPQVSAIRAITVEFVATWFLMFVICGSAVDGKAPKGIFGFAIGGTLTMCIFGIGNMTGAALNPTRYFGPAIGAWDMASMSKFYVYLMPFAGALAAAWMWMLIFYQPEDTREKLHDEGVEVEIVV